VRSLVLVGALDGASRDKEHCMWNQARITAAALAVALASAHFAAAQTESALQPQSQQAQPDTGAKPDANVPAMPDANVPDEKLDKAAAAIGHVVALKDTYTQRLQAAPDAERRKIMDEAKNALEKAVTDQGLSVEEYSKILRVAEADSAVRDKIMQRLRPAAD
jgi:hypothetical protein